MDPISQGAIGSAFAQATSRREAIRAAAIFGCLAGMAPDLDVFINSDTDPLLFLEYHRHFTHALIFIPVGALIVSGVLFRLFKHPLTFKQAYLAAFVGYASHGLLDACTSYGTQLFWPFSNVRVAWNNVSVVDPLFTLPLLVLVIASLKRRSTKLALFGIVWAVTYLGIGVIQNSRATDAARELAASLGHEPQRLSVKAGFANLLVWKAIYEHDDAYHVHAIRAGMDINWCPGVRVEKLDVSRHFPALDPTSQQAADIERFRWFSDDYLAPHNGSANIIDVRYSAVPNQTEPLWGIHVDIHADATSHVQFIPNRRTSAAQNAALFRLLTGEDCQPLRQAASWEGPPGTAMQGTGRAAGN